MANSFNVTIAEAALWSLQDPDRYRYNAMLADKGISIRERLDPDNQYRCLYDFDEQNGVIEILLFVSTKQDLEKMLYRYLVVK